MAVPIILGAVAGASALYGAYKGIGGAIDQSNASDINDNAESIVRQARRQVEEQRKHTTHELEDYGQRKLRAFNGPIADFLQTFERLKNVELGDSPELDKLQMGEYSSMQALTGLRQDYQAIKDAGLGLVTGLGGGAALAFGAYSGTMMLASASTGTAIASLSGAAATNATLAWLGGGALSMGGGGMALGSAILGGITAGVGMAIFGHIVGAKGEEALNNASSNREKARTIAADAKKINTGLDAIAKVTWLANTTFSEVTTQLRRSVGAMKKVIENEGVDFSQFTPESRAEVFRSVKFAQLAKALIDSPILDEAGNLVLSTKKRVEEMDLELGGGQVLVADESVVPEAAADITCVDVLRPSADLAKVVGDKPLPRTEAVKQIWAYIKKHDLQDAKNKHTIHADDLLKPIFGGRVCINMFDISGFLAEHLS